MRKILSITGEAFGYFWNPRGDQLLTTEGWPDDARVTGARYDPFRDVFEFVVESKEFEGPVEGNEPHWGDDQLRLTYTSHTACPNCGEPFTKTLEELSGSEQP